MSPSPRPHASPPSSVLVVSLDWLRPKDPRRSLGHASILARLSQAPGLEVRAVERAVNAPSFDRRELLQTLLGAARGDTTIAIGVYVWSEEVVQWLLPALRRGGFTGRLLLGGPQITYAPAGVLRLYPDADLAIRGPGEDALLAALLSPDPSTVPGVIVRGSEDLGLQAKSTLDALPSPILDGTLPIQPFMRWETQRGCIYACTFCQHRSPKRDSRPGLLAQRRVNLEIEAMVRGGVRDIAVLDPIFHTNPAAVDILQRFKALGYRGRLSLQSRFELIDEAFLDACAGLDVRLEFGLQTIHVPEMRAVRRMNKLGDAERVIAELHRRGIPFEVSLIYGLPEQTLASFIQSVRWCEDRGVPVVRAFPLMLLRGTGLDQDRARWGLVESDDVVPVVIRSDTFTESDWRAMRDIAEALDARVEGLVGRAA
ncbi:radical SAM protein [Myxococcota bacterium]|nr:radical SAM protein [Myxococcota bacterium]